MKEIKLPVGRYYIGDPTQITYAELGNLFEADLLNKFYNRNELKFVQLTIRGKRLFAFPVENKANECNELKTGCQLMILINIEGLNERNGFFLKDIKENGKIIEMKESFVVKVKDSEVNLPGLKIKTK